MQLQVIVSCREFGQFCDCLLEGEPVIGSNLVDRNYLHSRALATSGCLQCGNHVPDVLHGNRGFWEGKVAEGSGMLRNYFYKWREAVREVLVVYFKPDTEHSLRVEQAWFDVLVKPFLCDWLQSDQRQVFQIVLVQFLEEGLQVDIRHVLELEST